MLCNGACCAPLSCTVHVTSEILCLDFDFDQVREIGKNTAREHCIYVKVAINPTAACTVAKDMGLLVPGYQELYERCVTSYIFNGTTFVEDLSVPAAFVHASPLFRVMLLGLQCH